MRFLTIILLCAQYFSWNALGMIVNINSALEENSNLSVSFENVTSVPLGIDIAPAWEKTLDPSEDLERTTRASAVAEDSEAEDSRLRKIAGYVLKTAAAEGAIAAGKGAYEYICELFVENTSRAKALRDDLPKRPWEGDCKEYSSFLKFLNLTDAIITKQRFAKKVQLEADKLVESVRNMQPIVSEPNISALERLYRVAVMANQADPSPDVLAWADHWARWWLEIYEPYLLDTRSNPQKLLMYAVARKKGLIPESVELRELEKRFDVSFKNRIVEHPFP